ncbi:MAG: CPBP family intramembrane metalloprotease [Endomicrobiales bacterium]|nr:CPBP family intramembrane metalloprotease [Endomicrobiales bacterium]
MNKPSNMDPGNICYASKKYLFLYFSLTIPIAWVFWIPMILINKGVWTPPIQIPTVVWSTLGAISPLITIFIIQLASNNKITFKSILNNIRVKEWRSPWILTSPLFFIGIYLLIILSYFGIETFKGVDSTPLQIFKSEVFTTLKWWIILIIPIHFFAALITSPLFEEPGWRGFAFENLQHYVPRDIASLIVGSYWWLWHQGMNIAFDLEPTLYGYLSMLLDSFAIDAFYTLSKRNILAAMMAHQAMGTIIIFFIPAPTIWYALIIKLIAVVLLRFQIKQN